MVKMKDIPKVDRPRERFLEKGPDALSKSDLLAILLGSGVKGVNVQELSHRIIRKFGNNLVRASAKDLMEIKGIGEAKALQISAALSLAYRMFEDQNAPDNIILTPEDVWEQASNLRDKKKEHLVCFYLNARNALLKKEVISIGTIDKSLVHPREVFASGLEVRASGVIVVHNHPSGDPTLSRGDREVASRIVKAGKILGINVVDFVVVAKRGYESVLSDLRQVSEEKPVYLVSDGEQATLFDILEDYDSESYRPEYPMAVIKGGIDNFRFIDLFAGIGGFHMAAEELGGKCVFVSEFDEDARKTYRLNFESKNRELFDAKRFFGDITKVDVEDIPSFNFLFAGFPCQPFSKGGYRKGFKDTRGTLFFDVARIVKRHNPEFLLLENVSNLVTHDDGKTFRTIMKVLQELGYALNFEPLVLSPHQFGIPVIRQRIYIPAIRKDLVGQSVFKLDFSRDFRKPMVDAISFATDRGKKPEKYSISDYEKKVLSVWNEFYKGIDVKVIGFPIWVEEFGKNNSTDGLPRWKKNFVEKNRELYERNQRFIDVWLRKYDNLSWMVPTHRKFEWQAGEDIASVFEGLVQFRPSGVRVKRPDKFSTLVAMNHPQIIGKYARRLTPDETKRLQSFPSWFQVHENDAIALRQLGNSVNVEVVKHVIRRMFEVAGKIV